MAKLKGYAGSKAGDAKIKEVTERFQTRLAEERQKFGTEISTVLKNMSGKARDAREKVVPPTPEMLALLEAISYRQSLSMREYNMYLESCRSSNVAMASLYDMAKSKVEGGVNLQKPQGDGMKAIGILEELKISANALADWDGKNGMTGNTLASKAGEIDPSADSFERKVVGLKFDDGLMEAID